MTSTKDKIISESYFAIGVTQVHFNRNYEHEILICLEKGMQVLGEINEPLQGGNKGTVQHLNLQENSLFFMLKDEKNVQYSWILYRLHGDNNQEFIQAKKFSIAPYWDMYTKTAEDCQFKQNIKVQFNQTKISVFFTLFIENQKLLLKKSIQEVAKRSLQGSKILNTSRITAKGIEEILNQKQQQQNLQKEQISNIQQKTQGKSIWTNQQKDTNKFSEVLLENQEQQDPFKSQEKKNGQEQNINEVPQEVAENVEQIQQKKIHQQTIEEDKQGKAESQSQLPLESKKVVPPEEQKKVQQKSQFQESKIDLSQPNLCAISQIQELDESLLNKQGEKHVNQGKQEQKQQQDVNNSEKNDDIQEANVQRQGIPDEIQKQKIQEEEEIKYEKVENLQMKVENNIQMPQKSQNQKQEELKSQHSIEKKKKPIQSSQSNTTINNNKNTLKSSQNYKIHKILCIIFIFAVVIVAAYFLDPSKKNKIKTKKKYTK